MSDLSGPRNQIAPNSRRAAAIGVAALTAINVAGALGLAWLAATILFNDGVMALELGICAVLIAGLVLITAGALTFNRRGRGAAAIALLAVAALPTLAAYGFLFYLDSHPIHTR